ncbi:MAG: hypothetical protein JSW63_11500 [Ignavibacterium sp.]|nr:MAG: hypothetical protein JSW63_11500 [Ignavibacterium sp.]
MSEKGKWIINTKIFLVLLLITFPLNTFSWEKDEHQILADLVLDSTLSYCEIEFTDSLIFFAGKTGTIEITKMLLDGHTFGSIASVFSGDDLAQSRCHMKGHTIMQQIETLSAELIDEVWNRIKIAPDDIRSVEVADQNVVFNFLLYHLIALRFADISNNELVDGNKLLRYALIYEAVAQSYLSDAFSSGHFFLQVSDFLAPLNHMNIKITHEYYSFEGAYVIDSQGKSWQAFGDKLLQWFPTSFNRVFEACLISLRELFFVYFSSLKNIEIPLHLNEWAKLNANGISPEELSDRWVTTNNGAKYYSLIKMPSLLCIPMPLAASWSVRTEIQDKYGIHYRKHYMQLSNEKYHDPDLDDIDKEFLFSRSSVPNWMVPEFLPNDTLQNLIRYHPDIASVRYRQDRFIPPSFRGYLLIAGLSYAYSNDQNNFAASLGFGWGFTDEFLFVFIKPSIVITAMQLFSTNSLWILSADFGVGSNTPIFNIVKPRFEVGYAFGFQSPYHGSAGKFTLGLESNTLPLGFTYAGLTFRFKYQVITFVDPLHSPILEIILH